MKKNQKEYGIFIFLGFVAVFITCGFLFRVLSNRTLLSSPGIYGNSAGNAYNLGLFCGDGERIYFSNLNDQGNLYSMSYDLDDFEIIYNDNARYINTDENYVFYSRMNNLKDREHRPVFSFFNNGIFRVNKNGHNLKMLWNKPVGSVILYDNQIYYQHYEEKQKLATYRLSIDGKSDQKLFSDESVAVSIYDGRLYYGGRNKDRSLHSGSISDGATKVEIEGGFYNPIVNSDGVYYIDIQNDYRIKKCDLDGSNKKTLVRDACSSYNFSADGRYIIYQTDDSNKNGLYLLELESGEKTLIKEGYFKWINTVGDCCFFVDSNETVTYCYRYDKGLTAFNPPVLKK